NNIEIFHCSQMDEKLPVETTEGVVCWQEIRPIQKVGLYVPGGTAPLFSTVLMLAVPAQIAGCEDIVLCTPPDKNGEIHPAILYAAKLCGVKKIFKVGGIQAIASMTYGTETISSVYKLFGPGNQYVTAAKQYAQTLGTAIDMPAGPSELLVLADISAKPSYIASDLLSQAEHGEDSQVVFITDILDLIIEVERELEKQVQMLPREEIARRALKNSKLILMSDKQEMIEFINLYAPEHFILVVRNEEYFLQNIQNAGSVFIGNYTPESAGDYASGTNHTLPTGGFARVYSGLNMDAFTKKITFQKISPEGILKIGKSIELMAEEEGLIGHRNAVSIRLNDLLKKSSK
ncbi:MAG: histidinol dehydrogenase, partial [Bacteroidales bacterium]|nr:histidinol dehydrogenase [Bacteroidales bacterium]